MSCIFCDIIAGRVPSNKIYEDEDVFAMLDIDQGAWGHTLFIPKRHYENSFDIPEDVLAKVMAAAKRVACRWRESGLADGVNILHASGAEAEQSVFHFHMHLLPRRRGDGLRVFPSPEPCERDAREICARLAVSG
ncbi:MAG: HIT family protein [Rickettsiales bacterium]|jgi:histidine triad (HIT) family protein|nr:HIT family protein [Rickettsiales bacterium]